MNQILSLDLGTTSIGWLIREKLETSSMDEIAASGVVIFPEGFGSEKGNEFSLASKRREKRLIRRQYYRRKLRKYSVLLILIRNGMTPLTYPELKAWIKPDKGKKPEYPQSPEFHKWLRLQPSGNETSTCFANIYELRRDALHGKLHEYADSGFTEKQLLGRVLYNYAQRRGFLSNAKNKKDDPDGKVYKGIETLKDKLEGKHLAEYFSAINPMKDRIRGRYTPRDLWVQEFRDVCKAYPNYANSVEEELFKALFWVRKLKSQKDKVGTCTFEAGKTRIQLSHPDYELFRLLQFLQNIRIKSKDLGKEQIPNSIILKVADKIISEKAETFTKKELEKWLSGIMEWTVEIYSDTKFPASSCPVSNMLFKILGPEWRNWTYLKPEKKVKKNGKEGEVKVNWEGLWHFKKEVSERPEKFKRDKPCYEYALSLGLGDDEANLFEDFEMRTGYGSLSLNAIRRIVPFMLDGWPYHLAVLGAGMKRVLGDDAWKEKGDSLLQEMSDFEAANDIETTKVRAFNALLESQLESGKMPENGTIKEKLKFFSPKGFWKKWNEKGSLVAENAIKGVSVWLDLSLADPETARFKSAPTFMQLVKDNVLYELLSQGIPEEKAEILLGKLYHHSAIDKWQSPTHIEVMDHGTGEIRTIKQLNTPYTGSIQNPAAMRALHECKKLINYLLRTEVLREDATVIVEMARDLNDMNMRRAIHTWKQIQETERTKIRTFLVEQLNGPNPSEDQLDRTRLWLEQIQNEQGVIHQDMLNKQLLGREKGGKTDSLITQMQLWKEQRGICLYSGRTISISDVLSGDVQLEHTIPKSLSNDTRMENLTLSTGDANRLKRNRIPTELNQRENGLDNIEAIRIRLRPWEERIEVLNNQIKNKSKAVKAAKSSGNQEGYNNAVQERWVLRFERSYWKEKVERFYLEEINSGFARRQLVDTQIITKYVAGWLKTIFRLVRGTKGTLTADLRKQWGLQKEYEIKDRIDHTHHLIDAAVNAFTGPHLYNQLAAAYRNEEMTKKKFFLPAPWDGFDQDIKALCENTLIHHVYRDRTRVQTKKVAKNGIIQQGKGVKAKLHKETALANVRAWEKDESGTLKWKRNKEGEHVYVFATKKDLNDSSESGKPVFPKLEEYANARKENLKKDGDGRILPVLRLKTMDNTRIRISTMNEIDLNRLKRNEVNDWFRDEVSEKGLPAVQNDGFFLPVKKIRIEKAVKVPLEVRLVEKAFQNPERPHKHKMFYENDGNYAIAIYKNHSGKKEKRTFKIIPNLDIQDRSDAQLFPASIHENGLDYDLSTTGHGPQIYKVGKRVLLYENSPDEIWENDSAENIGLRLYTVEGLSIQRQKREVKVDEYGKIVLLHQKLTGKSKTTDGKVEDFKIASGDFKLINPPVPKRKFLHGQINALIEGIDFHLSYDGIIEKL